MYDTTSGRLSLFQRRVGLRQRSQMLIRSSSLERSNNKQATTCACIHIYIYIYIYIYSERERERTQNTVDDGLNRTGNPKTYDRPREASGSPTLPAICCQVAAESCISIATSRGISLHPLITNTPLIITPRFGQQQTKHYQFRRRLDFPPYKMR